MNEKNAQISGEQWLKISLQTPLPLIEAVSDLLGVLSGSGVELHPEPDGDWRISAFFPLKQQRKEADLVESVQGSLADLFQLYGETPGNISMEVIDDQDWATSWKRFFMPEEIVPGLVIKPSWENYQAKNREKIIEMDPGQAFGTGQHASTRMALSLLTTGIGDQQAVSRILDVGTGTGILAMAAALFGVQSVLAIDNDPEAVRVAKENILANKLNAQIRVEGTSLEKIHDFFPLIVANIVHDVLVVMAPQLRERLSPGGRIILAGILKGDQENNILKVYGALGLQQEKHLYDNEWASLLLQAPG